MDITPFSLRIRPRVDINKTLTTMDQPWGKKFIWINRVFVNPDNIARIATIFDFLASGKRRAINIA